MSTKIYDGFRIRSRGRFEDLFDLHKLTQFVESARDYMNEKATILATENFARRCTRLLDRETAGLTTRRSANDSIIAAVYFNLTLDEKLNRDNDYGVEITIHPIVGAERKVLGILFTGNRELQKEWFRFEDPKSGGYVCEYHYQDQTDPPENISERHWRWRRKDWELAVTERRGGIPAMTGLTATIVPEGLPTELLSFIGSGDNRQVLIEKSPPWNVRVNDVTEDLLFERWMDTNNFDLNDSERPSDIFNYFGGVCKIQEDTRRTNTKVKHNRRGGASIETPFNSG